MISKSSTKKSELELVIQIKDEIKIEKKNEEEVMDIKIIDNTQQQHIT